MRLVQLPATLPAHTLKAVLRRYDTGQFGTPVSCARLSEGLLNRGYQLVTARGDFLVRHFLKHHLEDSTGTIAHQHAATARLARLGLPAVAPLQDRTGATVVEVDGARFALHPWIEGAHRDGTELDIAQSGRLGGLLGHVHLGLAEVLVPRGRLPGALRAAACALPRPRRKHPAPDPAGAVSLPRRTIRPTGRTGGRTVSAPRPLPSRPPTAARTAADPLAAADPADTHVLIEELLARALARTRPDGFDLLAAHRLRERQELLRRYAHCRPDESQRPSSGWVHGDFHPLNLLYAPTAPHEPVAILDWDRLGVRPRAEEAVRAAVIFFLRPDGTLELAKIQAYARAYRRTVGAGRSELEAAVHRVWWERLNDFWMLRWHYQLRDSRTDRQFPAAAALVGWWTTEYARVRRAFCA